MRCIRFALLLIICAVGVSAADIPSYTVTVAAPRFSLVAFPFRLRQLCGPNALGCTQISGATLAAQCRYDDGAWRANVAASFVPYVFLPAESRERVLHHELTHIDDIDRALEFRVRALAVRSFPSATECQAAAASEGDQLDSVLRTFARQSFHKRR